MIFMNIIVNLLNKNLINLFIALFSCSENQTTESHRWHKIVGSRAGGIKPKTIKLVFVASIDVQNLFRIFSNVQNLLRIFSNVQNLFRIFSNVQNLFRNFCNFQNFQTLFRISSTKTGLFRISWLCSVDWCALISILSISWSALGLSRLFLFFLFFSFLLSFFIPENNVNAQAYKEAYMYTCKLHHCHMFINKVVQAPSPPQLINRRGISNTYTTRRKISFSISIFLTAKFCTICCVHFNKLNQDLST